jgi:predicted site-specific integrase-resolvase
MDPSKEATPKEVADTEGVTVRTVYDWLRRGHVSRRRLPGRVGRWRVKVDSEGHPIPAKGRDR